MSDSGSHGSVRAIGRHLGISESEIYGVATFYTQFRFVQPGEHTIQVCRGTACHVRGSKRLLDDLVRQLGIQPGETTPDLKFSLETVACFGSCALSPVVVIDDTVYGRVTVKRIRELIRELQK